MEIIFSFAFDVPEISTDGERAKVSLKGLNSYANPGEPVLPVKQVEILVPYAMDVIGIEFSGERSLIPGSYTIEWAEYPLPFSELQKEWAEPDPAIYRANRDFPGFAAQIISTEKFRGYNILLVHLYPVQYFPTQGKISFFSTLQLKVRLSSMAGFAVDELYRSLEKDSVELSKMVMNPGDISSYPQTPSPRGDSPLANLLVDYDHVIITPNTFRSAFQRLVDHKNSIGIASTIVSTEDIFADPAYDGVDAAEEIRNFIKDAYLNWGIRYALLGGDDYDDSGTLLVPERGCYLNSEGYVETHAACDIYFGALDGTWNDDNDSYWGEAGEIDYFPEVHIGRVTVDTVEELNTWLDKDLSYEQNADHPNLNQVLWLGEQLDSSQWGGDSKDDIIPLFPTDEYEFTKLYDRLGNNTKQACIDEMNNGPHLVNHIGHCNAGSCERLGRSDVDNLNNDFWFFNYSQGCMSGGWDQDYSGNSEAISEHQIFSQGGSFAVIMNSRYGWYSPGSITGPSQKYDKQFFDAIFQEGIRNLGAANDDSRTDLAGEAQSNSTMRWCYLELNLHGDPHTEVKDVSKPDHDILVYNLSANDWMEPGATTVSADVKNNGLNDESSILVKFSVDDVLQDTYTILSLMSGSQQEVSFPWNPTQHPRWYVVKIYAVPLSNEEILNNNMQQKSVVVDYPPFAVVSPDEQNTFDHHDASLDGSGSYDPDDSVVEYRWDFGDGASIYGATVTHQYVSSGHYAAKLTVTDGYMATGTDDALVHVWDRGHDMEVASIGSRKSIKSGKTYDIPVTIRNSGTYANSSGWTIPPGPNQSDYGLVTLTAHAPDGVTTKVSTAVIFLRMDEVEEIVLPILFDQRGLWTLEAHVDISDSAGNPNPFPKRDENPEDDDLSKTMKAR